MDSLDKIRTLLDLSEGEQDNILEILLEYAEQTISLYVGTPYLPPSLSWVAEQLVVKKFNRIGDEGVLHSVNEGIDMQYEEDDLKPFKDLLDRYIELNPDDTVKKGYLIML